MKKSQLLTACICSLVAAFPFFMAQGQTPAFSWARQCGGTGMDEGNDIAVAAITSNIYTTGAYTGLTEFDKNMGGWYLNCAGNRDLFISKTDANGNMIWLKSIGSTGDEYGLHICVDNLENVYVSGRFKGTVDFDPGVGVSNLTSAQQASFILKLTGAGNFAYAYSYGGTASAAVEIADILTDGSNNLVACGRLNGTWDFDPSAGTFNLSAYQVGFILKLNASGALVFARQLAASSPDYNQIDAFCVDGAGNLIITGILSGTADFDLNAGVMNLTASGATFANDYFVAKYTSAGALIWAGLTGGNPGTTLYPQYSALDASGNIYIIVRSMGGSVDFDITSGVSTFTTLNGAYWVQKLKSNGSFAWAYAFSPGLAPTDMKCNNANGLYIAGIFNGTDDFNPGSGVFTLSSNSAVSSVYDDAFLIKLDTAFNFQWAKAYGAEYDDCPNGIYVSNAGNVYTTGTFAGTGDFDPSTSVVSLTGKGSTDIFIQSINGSGTLNWVYGIGSETATVVSGMASRVGGLFFSTGYLIGKSRYDLSFRGGTDAFVTIGTPGGTFSISLCMGGPGNDAGTAVATDAASNIYLTGYFEQTADFASRTNRPAFNMTSGGGKDIFVMKMDFSGNLLWAKKIGGTSEDQPMAISLDNTGNLYVTGFYQGTVDFDPSAGTANLSSAGSFDAFVLKMDTAGNFIWAKSIGGTGSEIGYGVTADVSGNVLVTGSFAGTADFDPSASVFNFASAGNKDGFILKLNAAGSLVWAKQTGGSLNDEGRCVRTDSFGNIIVGGNFEAATDFDPGAGVFTITPSGSTGDIFLLKLNAAGNFMFAKSMGGMGSDRISGLTLDAGGNIYTSGTFNGTADLNPSAANAANFTSNGSSDVFISCYNSNFDVSWTNTIGGAGPDDAAGIAVDASNSVYVTGNFTGVVDLDPTPGVRNLTAPGENDIFALKLTQSSPLPVELLSFGAVATDNKEVLCKWSTASEVNNNYFSIERSRDGLEFEEIGTVASAGNSTAVLNYSFLDNSPLTGTSYYRLKQTDYDGRYSYSEVATVILNEVTKVSVNSLVNDRIHILVGSEGGQLEEINISLFTADGKLILQKTFHSAEWQNQNLTIERESMISGIYIYRINGGNVILKSGKLILQ